MRENYNSFKFWEKIISENKTIRGHMFMQRPPSEKSFYFHTLIFGDKNGINNIWGYVPNIKCLVGYIQYSFLQEAFYKWIYGQEKLVTRIPHLTVDKIVREAEKTKKISREIGFNMRRDYEYLNCLWALPNNRIELQLRKFCVDFNRRWMGDNREFIYLKIFSTPEELGEFVISSSLITNTEKELEEKMGITIEEWRELCKFASKDLERGGVFKEILSRKLSEIF